MTRSHKWLILAALPLVALWVAPAAAQVEPESSLTGSVMIGYRDVSIGGTENKYKEDINLDDGPRLFGLRFDFIPDPGLRGAVDRISLDLSNYGGDPYESLSLTVFKAGRYDFQYDRRKSDYFYQDIILPHGLADPDLSTGGDFHHFDFTRVRDSASLDLWLTDRAKLMIGLDRYTKRGESTTTLDISRDEFELDKPIHESFNDFSAGFQYQWDKATLTIEESYRDYENIVEIFLPGQSQGENVIDDLTVVDFFFLDQPYDFTSLQSRVTLSARPTDRFQVTAMGVVESLELDVTADEESAGIAFTGLPFTTDATGQGQIDRDIDMFDLDLSYLVNERVAIIGGVRQHSLDQGGDFVFDDSLREGLWDIETLILEAGVQFFVNPDVSVTLGLRNENRDVDFAATEESEEVDLERMEETDQTGYFASLVWQATDTFSLKADLEDASYDDPFTLTSPTDRQRYRLRGRLKLDNGFYGNLGYTMTEVENDNSGWTADTDAINLRLGYRQDGLNLSFGYNTQEIERDIFQLVTTLPGFGGGQELEFPIFYESDATFWDARLRWTASDRVTLGGDLRFYENEGSFALERDDLRVYADFEVIADYTLHVGYRTIDYEEAAFDFDDYDADIVEVGVGYDF